MAAARHARVRSGTNHRLRLPAGRKLAVSLSLAATMAGAGVIGVLATSTVADADSGTTGTVLLQDDQGGPGGSAVSTGTTMIHVTGREPGSTATTQCLGVTFAGGAAGSSLTLTAALGGTGRAPLQGQLTVDSATYHTGGTTAGSPTGGDSCAGYPRGGADTTIGTQGATMATWSAASPYAIAGPVTDTWYKFTVSGLPAGNDCAVYCNQTITLALTWTLTTS